MPVRTKEFDTLAINTLRLLAVDGVEKAKSGHPGMPMGCAPIAYSLYGKYLKHTPKNPKWLNRDRFILSAGHGSMLLYSILHLTGYNITLDDLKNFRQWESITPGHPENHLTQGVETTTGPLGQGFSNAIGMAIAQNYMASLFNKENFSLIDHYIYAIASDGDLMEGVSHETASLAGHLKLGKLIIFYDDNSITIDGKTSLSFSENVAKRFEAYNWQILNINDVNDIEQIESAIKEAQKETTRPSLIITKTIIGYGSPNKHNTAGVHGSPLGTDEVIATKKNLGWDETKFFHVPDEVSSFFEERKKECSLYEEEWNKLFSDYEKEFPQEAALFKKMMSGEIGEEWKKSLPQFPSDKPVATRSASGKVLNAIAKDLPCLIGGSADLAPSNNTYLSDYPAFSSENYNGRNFHFGIREHGMASILNGMTLYGGVIPYGGTFLVFSDYLRPAIRIASLSHIRPIYVFTHDSIGLGEDGPTHQPVEQLAALRAIPGLLVIRPADANETVYAWKTAIEYKDGPVAICLTRQNIPVIDRNIYSSAENLEKGGYILADSKSNPDVIIIATGSEVTPSLEAASLLNNEGIAARVVSLPCWELFEMQPDDYKESVLPSNVKARISVEAGVSMGWEKYIGLDGEAVSLNRFGASAPVKILMEKFGFTAQNISETAKRVISKLKK